MKFDLDSIESPTAPHDILGAVGDSIESQSNFNLQVTIVTASNLQFSGGGCFSTLSLTVSADNPPISILSINSAILPSIAGDVT